MMRTIGRRNFLKGLGSFSLGSSVFTLGLTRGSWAASIADEAHRESLLSMGTLVNLTIFGERPAKAREAARDAFDEIRRVDDLMSTHRRTSMLSRLNAAAGSEAIEVDPRVADVLRASVAWGERSGGVFDVTILPLLRVYGFRPEDTEVPESLEAARRSVNFRQIAFEEGRAGLRRKGVAVDVGGIAKGYAVDRAIAVLRDRWDVRAAIVAACGDLYALGRPVDEPGWTIGVRNPLTNKGSCAVFSLADAAVATSGATTERVTRGDRSYCDMFNPFTGEPTETYLSTTAYAKMAIDADAASTALFVAGREARAELVGPGISWLHIDREGRSELAMLPSPGFPTIERI